MKKLFSFMTASALVFGLAGCNSGQPGKEAQPAQKETVTLTYANWNLGTETEQNLERLMIQAFEEKYPNVKVKIDESISTKDWNGSLSAAASAGKMPDVFMLAQIPTALKNDWLLDLSDLAAKDKDFANVPNIVKESASYNGKLYAVPFAQHFLGFFVNKDLFNKANLDVPQYGMTVDQFTNAVKSVTNVKNGVAGLNHPYTFPDWYPPAANKDMGWYTYSNGKYQLDGKEFINGVNLAKTVIANGYAYETLKDDQKANFKGKDPEEVWEQGGVALKWDGTWGTARMSEVLKFQWDFVGIPGGRTVVTNDFVGISKSTKHAQEAYQFAKWMSFGKEGFLKRLEIAEKQRKVVNTLPIATDKEVLDKYFALLDVPGVRKAYQNLDNAIVEPVKIVPRFVEARWEAPTGVKIGDKANATVVQLIESGMKGEIKIEDYAKQLDQLADQKTQEAMAALKK